MPGANQQTFQFPRRIATVAIVLLMLTAGVAVAKISSERIDPKLCVTTGGGKFVKIPGFPGERIDRRLRSDVAYLVRKYKIFITDAYSNDPVHSANGEHPIGLAMDIVPNKAAGGSWKQISRLARWAEPKQNQVRAPFRWVGYNGDAGHGRGHHLHLSYAHSDTRPGKPARTIYSIKCPGSSSKPPKDPPNEPQPGKGEGGNGSGGLGSAGGDSGSGGALEAGRIKRNIQRQQHHPRRSRESGGIGVR